MHVFRLIPAASVIVCGFLQRRTLYAPPLIKSLMASPNTSTQVFPGKGLGFLILGASLHNVLTRLKARPQSHPSIELSYSSSQPTSTPIVISLPANGLRLRFDGPDQRLRLIEVLDFTKTQLSYKNNDIVRAGTAGAYPTLSSSFKGPTGPTFRHVYSRLFGPAFPGEYIPPSSDESTTKGTYILSYPGIAFTFPLLSSVWSPKANNDWVSILSSSAAEPAVTMAIFNGSSWTDTCASLYTRPPQYPRSLALAGKGKDAGPDEVEQVKVHGHGRIEIIRRSNPPFWITLSETTPQDLVAELGPPDAIYRKNDRRLSIHKKRASNQSSSEPKYGASPGKYDTYTDTDQSSVPNTTDDSDDDHDPSAANGAGFSSSAECFYNYFHHGLDVFISLPTTSSPPFPASIREEEETNIPPLSSHLTATKLLLHANIPGSYPFNRHRRSRWAIKLEPDATELDMLTSEMPFHEISERLKETWEGTYGSKAEEDSLQRGMVLNRGWGDSPGSSCELLGGWEDQLDGGRKGVTGTESGSQALGNTELFGFPGLIFEVLKSDAISCLTVY
ncbi:hypothetical protein MMC16_004184 [Acarospora aff. strigata]|nr:hypothetical protein [Acarospora aff. strigata]